MLVSADCLSVPTSMDRSRLGTSFVCSFFFAVSVASGYLLPNDTVPISYDLKITPIFNDLRPTFLGSVTITLTAKTDTNAIVLNARNLVVDRNKTWLLISDLFVANLSVTNVELNEENSLLIVNTTETLQTDLNYNLTLFFSGTIQEDAPGFSRTSYFVNSTKKWVGLTVFEATNARSVFPCYDEPRYKTNFVVEITVSKNQTVISNVPSSNVLDISNSTQTFVFSSYQQMPTWMLAWVIFDTASYSSVTSTVSGITVNSWARQSVIDQANTSSLLANTLLTTLAGITGKTYSLSKIDHFAVPNFYSAASENWGLIKYAEENFLQKSAVTTTRDSQAIALTIAHEVSHQWFGDIITADSWYYPWLKEGFAQYMQYYVTSIVNPNWQLMDQILVDLVQPALKLDSFPQHALNNYSLQSETDIKLMFDKITYNKGASIIRMLQNILGDNSFRYGLILSFRRDVNSPALLWRNFGTVASAQKIDLGGSTVHEIMTTWTDTSGFPLLTAVRSTNGTVNVTQKRFLFNGSADGLWWIPLTYITQDNTSNVVRTWLKPNTSATLSLTTNGWFVFNINQTGFYRVNYDPNNWELLTVQLVQDLNKIPLLNRAQLLDDAFNLAQAGIIEYAIAMRLSSYLSKELDYVPWVTALKNFKFLLTRYYNKPTYDLLKNYILSLMSNVIKDVGFDEQANESYINKIRRSLILEEACALGHEQCKTKSLQMLKSLQSGNRGVISDILNSLLCTAVQEGASSDWTYLENMYKESTVPTQRWNILSALTCTKNNTLLNMFLDSILLNQTSAYSSKHVWQVLKVLSSSSSGADALLNYLITNDYCTRSVNNTSFYLSSDYNENVLVQVIGDIVPCLTTYEQALKLENFTKNGSVCLSNSSVSALNSLIYTIHRNIEWQGTKSAGIYSWLSNESTSVTTVVSSMPPIGNVTTPSSSNTTTTTVPSGQGRTHNFGFVSLTICLSTFILTFVTYH